MLKPAERKALKARAHKLDPVVQIGARGLSAELLAEIERALEAHELIKVRAGAAERDERDRMLAEICEKTRAEVVQQVGKVFVIYREKTE